jgi:hypothetical protein
MHEEEILDYWEDELAQGEYGGGGISLYTLPPLAAVVISLVMAFFMIRFAQVQLSDVDPGIPTISIPDITAPNEPGNASEPLIVLPESTAGIAAFFTPSVRYWAAEIVAWAAEWDIEPDLAATVMQIESCGHPDVVSSAGATGLFQVMPYHFAAGERATDPDTNAYRGLSYLSRSLAAHDGDVYRALAGYNAGIGGSQRGEANWPAETKRYTYWGIGIYQDAHAGRASSERLAEWLDSGGSGLCRRAAERLGIGE